MMDTTRLDKSSAKGSGRRRSRNLLLRPAFQWKYAATVVLGVFLESAFIGIELFGILYEQARARVVYPATTGGAEIQVTILLATLAFAVVPALAFGGWSLFVTHRICGPLAVMETCLYQLGCGRFPRHRPLRKKDEFKDFYEVLWSTIKVLEDRKRSDLAALTGVLHTAKSAVGGDDQARRSALEVITPQLETLCADAANAVGEEYSPVPLRSAAAPPPGSETTRKYAEVAR